MKNRRPLLALFVFVCLGWCAGCGEPPPPPVVVPADFSNEPDVTALLKAKSDAAAAAPGQASSHRALGFALVANDGADLAEESFGKALAIDPADVESRLQLAKLLGAKGDMDGQIQELRRALEADPSFYAATYALGCALLDQGDLDEAEEAFRTVQEKQGPTLLGEVGLGLVKLERDRPEEALPLLTKASKKYPADLFIRFQLGQAYLALGQEERAAQLMAGIENGQGRTTLRSPGGKEIERYKVNRLARIRQSNEYIRQGAHARALPILKRLHELDETDTAAGNNLAIAQTRLGQLDSAMDVVTRCLEHDPDNYGLWVTKANALLSIADRERKAGDTQASKQQLSDALVAVDRAVELAPRVGRVHLVRGQALAALRRDGESVAAFREAIDLGETGDSTYINMSRALGRSGDVTAVESLLLEGIARPGPQERLRFELCGVLLKSGRGKEARAAQRELARVAPGSPTAVKADQILRESGY